MQGDDMSKEDGLYLGLSRSLGDQEIVVVFFGKDGGRRGKK